MLLAGLKCLVIGSGFFGSVIAERIASELNERVVVIEKRKHTGGNCHSYIDPETGIEIHRYGTHTFHTNSERVWNYITRFSDFTGYQHKVWTTHNNRPYPMPINLATINLFFEKNLSPRDVNAFIHCEAADAGIAVPTNLEEKAISLVGRSLYEAFIRGYTKKQWDMDPKQLPVEIITRLPVRNTYNINYYDDINQGLPRDGYMKIFDVLLSHRNIEIVLGLDYADIRDKVPPNCLVVYCGAIDEFFDYNLGALECRSLRLDIEHHALQDFQGTSVMNYADEDVPFTRIHEFKHLHPERERIFKQPVTVIMKEYPLSANQGKQERFYPIDSPRNRRLLAEYRLLSKSHPNVIFGGRLGQFKYWDMDQTILNALDVFEREIKRRLSTPWVTN